MTPIYKAIIKHLKDKKQLFIDAGLMPIAHYARYKGQYVHPELHQPYGLPALFFRFRTIWEDSSSNKQRGKCTIDIHLELNNYSEDADGSPDQDEALKDYEYIRLLGILLHGYSSEYFSALKRRETSEDEDPTTTNISIIRFEFDILDESTYKFKDMLKLPLDDMRLHRVRYGDSTVPGSDYSL